MHGRKVEGCKACPSGAIVLLNTPSQWTRAVIGTTEARGQRYNNMPICYLCLPNMPLIILLNGTITAYLAKERAAQWYVACLMHNPTLLLYFNKYCFNKYCYTCSLHSESTVLLSFRPDTEAGYQTIPWSMWCPSSPLKRTPEFL